MIIKINALAILFTVQFLIVFLTLTIVFYRQYRKQKINAIIAQGEARRLTAEIAYQEQKSNELAGIKEEYSGLQTQFDQIKHLNAKLKASLDTLIPQAKRTKEHELVIKDIEKYYAELDSFVRILKSEKEELSSKSDTYEEDIAKISLKLKNSISKEEYDYAKAQINRLELEVKKHKEELAKVESAHAEVEKNYVWLEKEYNALYETSNQG